jgi:putative ABC transport system permease protein
LLLAVVRLDLLAAWERGLPREAPNRFLINVQPGQVAELEAFLAEHGLGGSGLHPMVRGRLVRINDQPVNPAAYADPRAQRLAEREFNLSWGLQPQTDNRIQAGHWWSGAAAPPQFSVESGIAETLGIRLGDRLTYWVAGQELSAPVTSLRSVQWDSFNVNFFVVSPPVLLQDQPATYITSLYLPPEREAVAAELVRRFPGVTLLDVSALMGQMRRVMERGSAAVEYVFLFTLAAGLLVLVAGVQAGAEGRRQAAAVLRTLGARRGQLLAAAAVEQGTLGLLATLLGAGAAALTGLILARQVFGLDYHPSPGLWLLGSGAALVGIALAGLIAVRPLVVRPPMESLRRGE